MTLAEFYGQHWPEIKGKEVDILSGYQQKRWTRNAVISNVKKLGEDVYITYAENSPKGPSTIRSIKGIAT